jgi:uncharacterized protein YjbI with pentapeptide repeats
MLREVDFTNADCSAAVFSQSDLAMAHFEGSVLEKADFSSAQHVAFDPDKNKVTGAKMHLNQLPALLEKYRMQVVE